MPRFSRAAAAVLLFCALTGRAAAQEIRLNVVAYRLENGLRVLALEDHAVPAVSYYTFFRVGSRHERPGRTGISHLFEHMMFNGTRKHGPGVFDRLIETRGGFSNAFTAEDLTAYHEDFPADALEQVIALEADRMAGLLITEESLKSEREVVKEERRLRVDNDPEGSLFEALQATAYFAHPYQWPVIGWMADLDAITVTDCQEYFKVHYAPNNATIVVVGDLKPDRVIARIEAAYRSIPAQKPAAPVPRNEPEQQGERRVSVRRPAQLPAIAVAFHVPGTDGADLYALDLLEIILAHGDAARLNRTLVYEKELATRVLASNAWRIDPSLFMLYAEAKPGVSAAALEAALVAEIERLAREPLADAELRKAKNIRTTSLVKSLKTNSGKAEELGQFEIYFGGYARLFDILKVYEAVGAPALQAAAARYLHAGNRTVATLEPAAEEEGSGAP